MNPGDQRRSAGGSQYYADYANINNQGPRHNRPPDIPQVAHAMQDYADYSGENYSVYKFFLTLWTQLDSLTQCFLIRWNIPSCVQSHILFMNHYFL